MNNNKNTPAVNPFQLHKSINLPSNLLDVRRSNLSKSKKQSLRQSIINQNLYDPKQHKNPGFIQQKLTSKKKQVLYKRLSNIRVDNQQLGGVSFSKLLSRMVIMDDQKDNPQFNDYFADSKIKTLSKVKCLKQKLYNLQYQDNIDDTSRKTISKSIDVNQIVQPSKKLFKKYYMPHSQVRNPNFFRTISPQQKYIYKNGNRIQCKRIHNFYTSHMFKRGYDRFFRKTAIQGFNRYQ